MGDQTEFTNTDYLWCFQSVDLIFKFYFKFQVYVKSVIKVLISAYGFFIFFCINDKDVLDSLKFSAIGFWWIYTFWDLLKKIWEFIQKICQFISEWICRHVFLFIILHVRTAYRYQLNFFRNFDLKQVKSYIQDWIPQTSYLQFLLLITSI